MPDSDKIQQLIIEANSFKNYAASLLLGTEYEHMNIGINADIERLINRLTHMTGANPVTGTIGQSFAPLTSFMGDPIPQKKELQKDDYTPGPDEHTIFQGKVDALYNQFTYIPNESLISNHMLPEDQLVLRGVAGKAGVDDFKTQPFTVAFMQAIKDAINKKHQNRVAASDYASKLTPLSAGSSTTSPAVGSPLQGLPPLPATGQPVTTTPLPNDAPLPGTSGPTTTKDQPSKTTVTPTTGIEPDIKL